MLTSTVLLLSCFLPGCAALSDVVASRAGGAFVLRREQGAKSKHAASDFSSQHLDFDLGGHTEAVGGLGNAYGSRHPSYGELVLIDGPDAYYPLNDASPNVNEHVNESAVAAWGGTGRLSESDGIARGNPEFEERGLIDSDAGNTAILFTGSRRQAIKLPGSPQASNRTIELWFKSNALTYSNQTLYMEGDENAGIHIFASMQDGFMGWENGPAYLYMFAWNRASHDAPFGTDDALGSGPIRCEIRESDINYIALVFEGSAPLPRYKGYIKRPGSDWTARHCGSSVHLPVGASLEGHSLACIGGVCGTTRNSVREVIREGNATTNYLEGADHAFHGTIDEVAIYNLALDHHRINNHVAAAMG